MRALLTIVRGEGTPRVCELDPARPITIGRSRQCQIILRDERASREHALVYHENDQWLLRDNKTLNGTRIAGEPIAEPVALSDGVEFDIADLRLRYSVVPDDAPVHVAPALPIEHGPPDDDSCQTPWYADELAVLHTFMTRSAEYD